jgi:hypothetical protein
MYDKYRIIHIVLGVLGNSQTDVLFLMWQFGQLAANVRVFLLDGVVKEGNDLPHTLMKLLEFGVGRLFR